MMNPHAEVTTAALRETVFEGKKDNSDASNKNENDFRAITPETMPRNMDRIPLGVEASRSTDRRSNTRPLFNNRVAVDRCRSRDPRIV
jgi:hypothetical protein